MPPSCRDHACMCLRWDPQPRQTDVEENPPIRPTLIALVVVGCLLMIGAGVLAIAVDRGWRPGATAPTWQQPATDLAEGHHP